MGMGLSAGTAERLPAVVGQYHNASEGFDGRVLTFEQRRLSSDRRACRHGPTDSLRRTGGMIDTNGRRFMPGSLTEVVDNLTRGRVYSM